MTVNWKTVDPEIMDRINELRAENETLKANQLKPGERSINVDWVKELVSAVEEAFDMRMDEYTPFDELKKELGIE